MTSAAASSTEVDSVHMRRALDLALGGWGNTAPNPMVGAVVVSGGAVVGEGFHARFGEAHAEVVALRAAGERARGATIYVTLEPCAHVGKTPPCADALIAAGVARVVIAAEDPGPVARGGAARLRAAGIAVDVGVERDRALELNAPFFHAIASDRPWVTLKLALSAEGAIADATGRPRWITGPESRREVHHLRAGSDAIAVGIGTVLADDPALTVRDVPPPRVAPKRVVFDSSLRTPADSVLARSAREVETILVAMRGAEFGPRRARLEAMGIRTLESDSLADGVRGLREAGVRSLFVEGGARLAGSLLREDLVDRLIIFRAPTSLGPGALPAFEHAPEGFERSLGDARHRVVESRQSGDDTMTVYALHEVQCSPG